MRYPNYDPGSSAKRGIWLGIIVAIVGLRIWIVERNQPAEIINQAHLGLFLGGLGLCFALMCWYLLSQMNSKQSGSEQWDDCQSRIRDLMKHERSRSKR